MKFNTAFVLLIFILFQNCYSYKTIEFNNIETLNKEQVKIKLKNSTKIKGVVIQSKIDSIYVQKKQKTFKISKTEIERLKKRQFSWGKTTVLSVVYSLVVSLGITLFIILAPFS